MRPGSGAQVQPGNPARSKPFLGTGEGGCSAVRLPRFRSLGYFRILAKHVAAAANSLVADPSAEGERPIQLIPVLQRLPLEIIGSVMFSLR